MEWITQPTDPVTMAFQKDYLRWWVGSVREFVEPLLKHPLTESELALIERKIVECKDAGMNDRFAIFYSCLLELPDYQGEREDLEQLLRQRLADEIGSRMQ